MSSSYCLDLLHANEAHEQPFPLGLRNSSRVDQTLQQVELDYSIPSKKEVRYDSHGKESTCCQEKLRTALSEEYSSYFGHCQVPFGRLESSEAMPYVTM